VGVESAMPTVIFPCTFVATFIKGTALLTAFVVALIKSVPAEAACAEVACTGSPCAANNGVVFDGLQQCVYVKNPTQVLGNEAFFDDGTLEFLEIIIPYTNMAIEPQALAGVNQNRQLSPDITESGAYESAIAAVPEDQRAVVEAALPLFFVVAVQCAEGGSYPVYHDAYPGSSAGTTGNLELVQEGYYNWAAASLLKWVDDSGLLPQPLETICGFADELGIEAICVLDFATASPGIFYPIFLDEDGMAHSEQLPDLPAQIEEPLSTALESLPFELPAGLVEALKDPNTFLKMMYGVWQLSKIGQVIKADPAASLGYLTSSV